MGHKLPEDDILVLALELLAEKISYMKSAISAFDLAHACLQLCKVTFGGVRYSST
jgi:hypothetical protein